MWFSCYVNIDLENSTESMNICVHAVENCHKYSFIVLLCNPYIDAVK
jgi:hypothetical protein